MYKKLIENIAFREDGLTKTLMRAGLLALPGTTASIAKHLPDIAKRKGKPMSDMELNELNGCVFPIEYAKTFGYGVIGFIGYLIFIK